MRTLLLVFILGSSFYSCEISTSTSAERLSEFDEYWNKGKAELTSYKLEQARYGEIHHGDAVLIFVTEHFSKTQHVKVDKPSGDKNALPILKLNSTRKFNTGIYPYSLMTSVFTPVEIQKHKLPLKVSFSAQEWCGHAYSQIELDGNSYQYLLHSYFESENDQEKQITNALSEDALMNYIRLNPESLPIGEVELLPSQQHLRLLHKEMKAYQASTSIEKGTETSVFKIKYKNLDRELRIEYKNKFPFEIQGWEEKYTSGWGDDAVVLSTKATLNKRIMLDYWNKHDPKDLSWRKELGLLN